MATQLTRKKLAGAEERMVDQTITTVGDMMQATVNLQFDLYRSWMGLLGHSAGFGRWPRPTQLLTAARIPAAVARAAGATRQAAGEIHRAAKRSIQAAGRFEAKTAPDAGAAGSRNSAHGRGRGSARGGRRAESRPGSAKSGVRKTAKA